VRAANRNVKTQYGIIHAVPVQSYHRGEITTLATETKVSDETYTVHGAQSN